MTHLRCRRDVHSWQPNIRCPSNIPHPVLVTADHLVFLPLLCLVVIHPGLDQVVRPGRHETFLASRSWCPRHCVSSGAVSREHGSVCRAVVCVSVNPRKRTLKVDHGDFAVARGASEDRSELVRGPGERVDWDQQKDPGIPVPGSPLAVCRLCSLILSQPSCSSPPPPFPGPTSFQMNTRPSYEHEARMEPKEG